MTDTSDIKQTYENMFSHRFTAQDAEYQEYLKMPESQPPIVEDWRGGNQRNQDRNWRAMEKAVVVHHKSQQANQQHRGAQDPLHAVTRYRDNRHQRGWEGRRDWSNNSYSQQRGGRGWGSSHNQYRQERSHHQSEGHHSYHSGNQRFYPDRY